MSTAPETGSTSSGAPRPPSDATVVVIGGGITGLTIAWKLYRNNVDVVLLEASERLGGKILSTEVMGLPVDAGPDAFVVRQPFMEDLCRELELHNALVPPVSKGASIWLDGALRPLPKKQYLGVPLDLDDLAASGLVSAAGIERARLDLTNPEDGPPGDESVGSLIRRRLGDEVLERLTGPLLAGINAGNVDQLSLRGGVPQLAAGVGLDASLMRSLQKYLGGLKRDPNAPIFLGHPNSMGQVVTALSDRLLGRTSTDNPVHRLERTESGWRVHAADDTIDTNHVVLATPAFAAANLLAQAAPDTAALLRNIRYASVVQTTFAYASRDLPDFGSSGFLVPKSEGLLMTACTFASSKWPHLAIGSSRYLRVHAGKVDDDRAASMDDPALVARLREELSWTAGVDAEPLEVRITRWPRSFPQYGPGHLERVAGIEATLAHEAPGIIATGAAYRGLGLPACVHQANDTTRSLLLALGFEPSPITEGWTITRDDG